jgi:hypothetical protein
VYLFAVEQQDWQTKNAALTTAVVVQGSDVCLCDQVNSQGGIANAAFNRCAITGAHTRKQPGGC